nr:hypothetical protein [Dyella ginsengisoli]
MRALDVRGVALRLNQHALTAMGELAVDATVAGVAEISLNSDVVIFDSGQDQLLERQRVNPAEIAQSASKAVFLPRDVGNLLA